jgi:hypothetical protein
VLLQRLDRTRITQRLERRNGGRAHRCVVVVERPDQGIEGVVAHALAELERSLDAHPEIFAVPQLADQFLQIGLPEDGGRNQANQRNQRGPSREVHRRQWVYRSSDLRLPFRKQLLGA